ncbi:SDH family Clp fold serine proteinase [Pseudomonas indica]|uniref:SDH family Clp fold serine proteinase n=1 Tax=Pseudomonas indica TaxID=137658 RepID=UPI003FD52CC3
MKMAECFPRTSNLPSQSPLFWVTHKDRYLRQLLIRDIQSTTNRELIVYFTECERSGSQIDMGDDVYFAELLRGASGKPIDLLIETNGGYTDPTEKICSLLRQAAPDLRVIIPRRAKSNGTVIALCGSHILMGLESELGPIDPSLNGVPVEFILKAPPGSFNPIEYQLASTTQAQTVKLAKELLSTGMMQGSSTNDIDETIAKMASRGHYHSHGSVIDMREATELGLQVIQHPMGNTLWQQLWLLRTMYQYDCLQNGYAKLFESASVSTAVSMAAP